MNKIILMGRLTKDPEVRYTQTGKVVAQFQLAIDRPFKTQDGQKETDYIPVVLWGKIAELVGNGTTKGQRLLVEGRLQIRDYEAKDGTKRWVTEVIANNIEFIEYKENNSQAKPKDDGSMESFGTAVPFDDSIPF